MWACSEKLPQLCPQWLELNPGAFHHLSNWSFMGAGTFLNNLYTTRMPKVKLGET